jgi:hypothetical protein
VADLSKDVPGYAELVEFYGEFPSFHDAEIVSVHLNRIGISQIVINLSSWDTTSRGKSGGVVTLSLEGIDDLELDGFSHQNVINGMALETAEAGFEIKLWPCFGISGSIRARKVSIQFVPSPVNP